jgi:hypothetical protein
MVVNIFRNEWKVLKMTKFGKMALIYKKENKEVLANAEFRL